MTSQLNVDTIVDKAGSGGTNVKVANTSTYVSDAGSVTQNTVQSLIVDLKIFLKTCQTCYPCFQACSESHSKTRQKHVYVSKHIWKTCCFQTSFLKRNLAS